MKENSTHYVYRFGAECDITGNVLDVGLCLFSGEDTTLIVGEEGLEKLNKFFRKNSNEERFKNYDAIIDNSVCFFCEEKRETLSLYNSRISSKSVCQNCISSCRQVYEKGEENLLHSEKLDFKVLNLPKEICFHDLVQDKEVKSEKIVVFFETSRLNGVYTKISNIYGICEGLEKPEDCSFIVNIDEDSDFNKESFECEKCSQLYKKETLFGTFFLCRNCREDLHKSVSNYIDNNEKEIMSLLI